MSLLDMLTRAFVAFANEKQFREQYEDWIVFSEDRSLSIILQRPDVLDWVFGLWYDRTENIRIINHHRLIDEELRGRGIGSELLIVVEKACKALAKSQRHIVRLDFHISRDLSVAPWFEKRGYVRDGHEWKKLFSP